MRPPSGNGDFAVGEIRALDDDVEKERVYAVGETAERIEHWLDYAAPIFNPASRAAARFSRSGGTL